MDKAFTADDLAQIEQLGLSESIVRQQLANYRQGFAKTQLIAAATIDNGGIVCLSDDKIAYYEKVYSKLAKTKKILKFVPASGAATRMFKDLYEFSSTYFGVAHNFEKEFPEVQTFLENIRSFAFFNDLNECMERSGLDLNDYMVRGDYTAIINFLLKDKYLGYGSLPKALLKFHTYGDSQRTPLEEHIVESAEYAQSSDGKAHLVFSVSPEHKPLFRKKIAEIKKHYEEEFHISLDIVLTEQKHYTDSISVDEYNEPLRDEDGKLIFNPGGHGALIENLDECRADIIFIKNIDNVVPDWMKHTTTIYKKVLGGMLLTLQQQIFEYIDILHSKSATPHQVEKCAEFCTQKLHIELEQQFDSMTLEEKKEILVAHLDRPIRICGMVKNQGEPGGGPYFTHDSHGINSLQIVEAGQINHKEPTQESIFQSATHFNPVDVVCSTKDYRGRHFDLHKFTDPDTGFIVKKSKGANYIKTQELPGLWNGAMARWNTVFVEVPLATFNPVKKVNDLLRKEHLG